MHKKKTHRLDWQCVLGIAFNNRGFMGWLLVIANLEYSISVFKFRNNENALKLAFIINMIMYAVFSLAIMNYVGALSCTVIEITTAISLIRAKQKKLEHII